jgi:tripartite-type tricarboxylate transporter receptor subunit TctC
VNTILYIGLVGPAGLPEPVVARLTKELDDMPNDPKVRERMKGIGSEFAYIRGPLFRDIVVKDLERWRDVAKSAGITISD